MEAQELKSQLSSELMDQENVTGVGIGQDEDGNEIVVVNVKEGTSNQVALPQEFEDEDVEFRELGEFSAEVVQVVDPEAIDRKAKHRPVPGGVSAGHSNVTAGTTGFIVEDDSGNQYPTSNNHVYADVNEGSEGDTIIQPGSADGGSTQNDQSGVLEGYVEVRNGAVLDFAWISGTSEHVLELAELGKPQGQPTEVSVGDTLTKSGRTTGVTEGDVNQVDVDVNVNYGDAGTFQINDCIITDDMSDGGDSGSAVLLKSTMEPAGVLFAGSDSATVMNKATNIEPETGLSIVTAGSDSPPTASVTLTLEKVTPDTGNMIVRVNNQSGNAVEAATVSATGASDQSGTTDATGVTSFKGIPIGEYTVEATKDGYNGDSATITESDFQ